MNLKNWIQLTQITFPFSAFSFPSIENHFELNKKFIPYETIISIEPAAQLCIVNKDKSYGNNVNHYVNFNYVELFTGQIYKVLENKEQIDDKAIGVLDNDFTPQVTYRF